MGICSAGPGGHSLRAGAWGRFPACLCRLCEDCSSTCFLLHFDFMSHDIVIALALQDSAARGVVRNRLRNAAVKGVVRNRLCIYIMTASLGARLGRENEMLLEPR